MKMQMYSSDEYLLLLKVKLRTLSYCSDTQRSYLQLLQLLVFLYITNYMFVFLGIKNQNSEDLPSQNRCKLFIMALGIDKKTSPGKLLLMKYT